MDEMSFRREKISSLDQNPWDDSKVDSIADYGFYAGVGPRVGIVTIKPSLQEQKDGVQIMCTAVEQLIHRLAGCETLIHVHIESENVCLL